MTRAELHMSTPCYGVVLLKEYGGCKDVFHTRNGGVDHELSVPLNVVQTVYK